MRQEKEERKPEETEPIFEVAYLGNAWSDFAQIWNVECCSWRACPQQKSSCFIEEAQSYGGAKIAFSFFLSIYSRVLRAGFLGRTTHYHVSWCAIYFEVNLCTKYLSSAQTEERVVYKFNGFMTNKEYYNNAVVWIIMLLCESSVVTYLAITMKEILCVLFQTAYITHTHLLCTHNNHDREKAILYKKYILFSELKLLDICKI